MTNGSPLRRRILLVSNRLPVTAKRVGGALQLTPSSGGLATALRSFNAEGGMLWFGWPGSVPRSERKEVEERLTTEHAAVPVFLPERLAERFYEGFSNRTLWPLFHSFPSVTRYAAAEWEAYQEATARFCERIAAVARPDDMVWVHDYQLMLLPLYLRKRFPTLSIGFFLHIPFPPFEVLRVLPQHRQILESLLAADLVGFHTHDYAQAFLGAVRRSLGYDHQLGQMVIGRRIVQVDVFPIGIDFPAFADAASAPGVEEQARLVREGSEKVILSISRLDYTKGLPQSLESVEALFIRHPEWREKVTYVFVVVPSREKVERYASLKREIDELIGRINSTFGTLHWTPIRYIYRSLSHEELIGLYVASEVALILPLRDGMNLIAKEYLAARPDGTGVLVLSDLTGSAKELIEALIVNPNAREEVADALARALAMPVEEQKRRNEPMRKRLQAYDVRWWVDRFLTRQEDVRRQLQALAVKDLDAAGRGRLLEAYRSASGERLLLFDYDGTLVPFAEYPSLAKPDPALLVSLRALTVPANNRVVILSSRDRQTLEEWLGSLDLILAAEHGAWVRWSPGRAWETTITGAPEPWKRQIRPMLELFVDRIPGSFIEDKDFSLVWHYRQADSESGRAAARELLDTLSSVAANLKIQVLPSSKAVEVKTMEMTKGSFFARFLANPAPQFVLAAGDDWKDEDLFAALPETAFSIRVGISASAARFNVHALEDIRQLLTMLEERNNVHTG